MIGAIITEDQGKVTTILESGMKVRIYYNLHKHKWSIQTYRKGKGWRLAGHTDIAMLTNAEFKVYESGRQETIRRGQKTVHAYVIGTFDPDQWIVPIAQMSTIGYNPYKNPTFMKGQEPILKADYVYFTTGRKAYVK